MNKINTLLLTFFVTLAAFSLSVTLSSPVSAQYDCGSYGYSTYGNQQDCGGASGSSGGGLSNTGEALSIIIPAVLVVIGSAGLYKASRKTKKRKNLQK